MIKSKPNTVYVFDGDTPTKIHPFSAEQLDPLSLLEEKMGEYHSLYYSENDDVYSVSGDSVVKTDSSGIRSVVIHVPRRVPPPVYLISFFLGLALLLYLQRLINSCLSKAAETVKAKKQTERPEKAYKNQSPDTKPFLHAIPPTGIEKTKAFATTSAH